LQSVCFTRARETNLASVCPAPHSYPSSFPVYGELLTEINATCARLRSCFQSRQVSVVAPQNLRSLVGIERRGEQIGFPWHWRSASLVERSHTHNRRQSRGACLQLDLQVVIKVLNDLGMSDAEIKRYFGNDDDLIAAIHRFSGDGSHVRAPSGSAGLSTEAASRQIGKD